MYQSGKKLIVVLGMHRSGTSAITRGLQVMGVGLGDKISPPFEGINDKGFWEDIDINALNIEMLSAIDSDWYHLTMIDSLGIGNLHKQGYFHRAVELLQQKVSGHSVFGFKDPRLVKLLPFWKEVFNYCQFDVSYVIIVRHPLSVVMSLAKRDGIEAERSYLMWIGHVISSLTGSTGEKRVFIDYDSLMQSADREINRIAEFLNLNVDSIELQNYKNNFLDESLRHTAFNSIKLLSNGSCPPLVQEIYTALLAIVSDKLKSDDPNFLELVALWSKEFKRLKSILSLIDKLVVQIENLSHFLAEGNVQEFHSFRGKKKGGTHIHKLEADWIARGQHIVELEQSIADQTTHIRNVEADWSARGKHIESLEQIIADQTTYIRNVEADWSARGTHIASLEQIITDRTRHINNIEAELIKFQSSWYGKLKSAIQKLHRIMTSR